MTPLSGKVQSFDGLVKVFMFDDVKAAVLELKSRLSKCKNKDLVVRSYLNGLIDEVFSDVTVMVTTEFKDDIKNSGGEKLK